MSTFDPKEKLRKMAKQVLKWPDAEPETPQVDPGVAKYAERIKGAFHGISDDLALRMAKETYEKHVRN